MKRITAANYKKDKLYPKVARAVTEILRDKNQDVVAPVDVFMRMDRLRKEKYEDWRFGRVPYLEKVVYGNLSQANRILRILHQHAGALKLIPQQAEYRKWGKRGKHIRLRFSKYGDAKLEAAYSWHYIVRSRSARKRANAPSAPSRPADATESRNSEDPPAERSDQ